MKKTTLLKTMLLLCALIVGGSSAWADTVTFNYADYKGQGTESSGSEYTMQKTDVSIGSTKFFGNNSQAHFYAGGVITVTPSANVTITKIVITTTSTSYNGYQSKGSITASTGSMSHDGTEVTWTGSATSAFTLSHNKQIRWTSIEVTYTKSADESDSPLASIALSGTYPTVFNEGDAFSHEGMTVTATYENATTKDVTASATFSGYDMDTPSTQTVTVSYKEGDVTKSATYKITVNEIPSHNVIWNVNGITTAESYKEGATIVFPSNPIDLIGKKFVGWSTSTIDGTTDSEPSFVTAATMNTSDITYYAVYATASGSTATFSKYEKVTSAPDDWSGTYLLGATYTGGSDDAKKGTFVFSGFGATTGDRTALVPGSTEYVDYEIVIAKDGDHYTIYHTNSSKYFALASNDNHLDNSASVTGNNQKWDIDEDGVITSCAFTTRSIRYNGSSPRFATYTSGQTPTDLYRRIETGGITYSDYCTTITVNTPAVTSVGWATYVTTADVEFTDGDAFAVSSIDTKINLTAVTKVKAGTPLLLKGVGAKTARALPETPANVTNLLEVSDGDDGVGDFVLAYKNEVVGFYKWAGSALSEGRVYLPASEVGAREFIGFDDVTGIELIERENLKDLNYYNLAGQRVAQPSTGLYIVNGKKIIIK